MKLRFVVLIVAALTASPVWADVFNYVCVENGRRQPVRIDDKQNTLTWKGQTYAISENPDCAKFGWRAVRDGKTLEFCTATKGVANLDTLDCQLKQ